MKLFLKVLAIVLLSFQTQFSFGQLQLSDKAEISLLTCGSGNELYSIYGHTALRINDAERGLDIVYNYGTFDFSTPNFYGKFIKGDLQYFVSTSSFEEFNYAYIYDNREIIEQVLNLSQEQKQKIFNELSAVLSSDKRFYTYKFIDRNCTTMVADLINSVLKEKISTDIPNTQHTYRRILYGYLDNNFYENLGINLMFGLKTDQQSDKLFLPVELQQGVNLSQNQNQKLVKAERIVYSKRESEESKTWWNSYLTFAAICIGLFFLTSNRKFQIIWLTIAGLFGLFISSVGLYSLHKEVLLNYNALLMNPLFIILAISIGLKKQNLTKYFVVGCAVCLIIYTLFISLKVQFLMMLPLIVLHGLLLWKLWKNKVTTN
ncbi:DUF4105 domain-containing protein [Flavobacterium sp.]|uniref:lipoprotein N-acyltransferase Lnb domain-containing protein n=1 Tax=Flavobacterium sp. TaxID=239 RepID=UPI0028BE289A|nr:DUF4105 domain-containing protein [Flavobacterium sp.]